MGYYQNFELGNTRPIRMTSVNFDSATRNLVARASNYTVAFDSLSLAIAVFYGNAYYKIRREAQEALKLLLLA